MNLQLFLSVEVLYCVLGDLFKILELGDFGSEFEKEFIFLNIQYLRGNFKENSLLEI